MTHSRASLLYGSLPPPPATATAATTTTTMTTKTTTVESPCHPPIAQAAAEASSAVRTAALRPPGTGTGPWRDLPPRCRRLWVGRVLGKAGPAPPVVPHPRHRRAGRRPREEDGGEARFPGRIIADAGRKRKRVFQAVRPLSAERPPACFPFEPVTGGVRHRQMPRRQGPASDRQALLSRPARHRPRSACHVGEPGGGQEAEGHLLSFLPVLRGHFSFGF